MLTPSRRGSRLPEEEGTVQDDRLRLIFTCCHPALSTEAQVALTLRFLGGLTTEEVARAFLVTEPTMAQRLARAKRKIKAARIPYRVPEEHELPERLRPVLAVVYLIYTAGLTSQPNSLCQRRSGWHASWRRSCPTSRGGRPLGAAAPHRIPPLIANATRRLPGAARRPGSSRWDRALIEEGQAIVRRCLRRNQLGAYQLQAAINAVHADAARSRNRLVADRRPLRPAARDRPHAGRGSQPRDRHRRGAGPAAALALVDELDLDNYYPFHATRADLLRRLGRDQRGRGRVRARGRDGADRRRARIPQARWPSPDGLWQLRARSRPMKALVLISQSNAIPTIQQELGGLE